MAVIEVPDWYRTVALVGVDITGTPVVVLLDSTGAIVSVMKGEYSGILKNVQVDAQGRLIMIPTDPLDIWGNAISMGNAELAAVLSIATRFDRRGNVVWLDSFEDGFAQKWKTNANFTGTPALSTTGARTGAYSVKLETTALSGAGCGIIHYRPLPVESKVSLEASFAIEQNVESIQFRLELYDGTSYTIGAVKYLPGSDKWLYLSSGVAWIDLLTSISLIEYAQAFHTVKLVLDYNTDKYVRVLADEREQALTNIPTYTGSSVTTPFLGIYITVVNNDTNVAKAYVDDVILKQNEPA